MNPWRRFVRWYTNASYWEQDAATGSVLIWVLGLVCIVTCCTAPHPLIVGAAPEAKLRVAPILSADFIGDNSPNVKMPARIERRRALECAHLLFYFLELLGGCWFLWRGTFWIGYLGRRGWKGIGMVLLGYLLTISGGFFLFFHLFYR